ncbi:cyclophilin family peptidyl-prolyl cis-trans isomerase [Stackebrandtia albiflava]|uniref:Cyclophilin family peptidyl-prolyl cis-trans isomerase n=1 Tax=Stackebrandtia albiflava TaxID=406432 RepID=A0A562V1T2_9ACTN|nr:peptidylprolyl isomerase [Stackebrandtia albiflava]TWJ11859.1 cyclophilin family peptidyl-prolyl cis-trans isomerase [Stackebrandtia albiflava]
MNGKQDDSPSEATLRAGRSEPNAESAPQTEAPTDSEASVAASGDREPETDDATPDADKTEDDGESDDDSGDDGEKPDETEAAEATAKPAKVRRPRPEELEPDDPFGGTPPWLQRGDGRRTALGITLTLALVAVVGAVGWLLFGGPEETDANAQTDPGDPCHVAEYQDQGLMIAPPRLGVAPDRVTATVATNFGPVTVLLFGDLAPCGVSGFTYLAGQGFYAGNNCHRITTQPMAPTVTLRCGDPTGSGNGGPGYRFRSEQKSEGRAVLDSFALINDGTGQAGSAFAFVRGQSIPTASLSVIGQVIDGFEVLDQIGGSAGLEPFDGLPPQPVTILGVTVTEGTVTLPPSGQPGSGLPGSGTPSGTATPSGTPSGIDSPSPSGGNPGGPAR